jgi:hypothetical protein
VFMTAAKIADAVASSACVISLCRLIWLSSMARHALAVSSYMEAFKPALVFLMTDFLM